MADPEHEVGEKRGDEQGLWESHMGASNGVFGSLAAPLGVSMGTQGLGTDGGFGVSLARSSEMGTFLGLAEDHRSLSGLGAGMPGSGPLAHHAAAADEGSSALGAAPATNVLVESGIEVQEHDAALPFMGVASWDPPNPAPDTHLVSAAGQEDTPDVGDRTSAKVAQASADVRAGAALADREQPAVQSVWKRQKADTKPCPQADQVATSQPEPAKQAPHPATQHVKGKRATSPAAGPGAGKAKSGERAAVTGQESDFSANVAGFMSVAAGRAWAACVLLASNLGKSCGARERRRAAHQCSDGLWQVLAACMLPPVALFWTLSFLVHDMGAAPLAQLARQGNAVTAQIILGSLLALLGGSMLAQPLTRDVLRGLCVEYGPILGVFAAPTVVGSGEWGRAAPPPILGAGLLGLGGGRTSFFGSATGALELLRESLPWQATLFVCILLWRYAVARLGWHMLRSPRRAWAAATGLAVLGTLGVLLGPVQLWPLALAVPCLVIFAQGAATTAAQLAGFTPLCTTPTATGLAIALACTYKLSRDIDTCAEALLV